VKAADVFAPLLAALRRGLRAWNDFWFRDEPTPQLDVVRAGIGLAMFVAAVFLTPRVPELYADGGWIPWGGLRMFIDDPWTASVFFHLHTTSQVLAFHYGFIAACLCLCLGLGTPLVKWIVFIGEISYWYRCPPTAYGVDEVLCNVLLILCLAPVGRHYSVDAWLRRAWARRRGKPAPSRSNGWRFACTRLLQIQMVLILLFSGLQKIRGNDWWNGDAVWHSLTNYQFDAPLDFFAAHFWIVNLLTHGTLVVEVSYAFLIWGKKTRPFVLVSAIGLHLGIGAMMGLYYFSAVNIMGHLSFVRPEWLAAAGERVRRLRYSAQASPSPTMRSSI
jgi:hypothetical protein